MFIEKTLCRAGATGDCHGRSKHVAARNQPPIPPDDRVHGLIPAGPGIEACLEIHPARRRARERQEAAERARIVCPCCNPVRNSIDVNLIIV